MATIARSRLAKLLLDDPSKKNIRRVCAYMIETKRSKEIELLIKDIEYLAAEQGHVVAHVTCAHKLTDALKKQITDIVVDGSKKTKVEIDATIDPSLLGGVIIHTPGTELDLSLQSKINRLRLN